MSFSRTSTPIKSSKKEPRPCKNVEEEFTKRALQLMTSFYEPIPVADILTFPPVESSESPAQSGRRVTFNSSIADLRVKRTFENQGQNTRNFNAEFAQKVDELTEACRNTPVCLDNVFCAETTERPTKPLYIVNEERDFEEAEAKRRSMKKGLEISKIESEMKQRLNESQNVGKARAEKRVNRMSHITESSKKVNRENKDLWRGTLQKEYATTKYEPKGGYPVKRKAATPSKRDTSYYQE